MRYLVLFILALLTGCNPDLEINGHDQQHHYVFYGEDVVFDTETRFPSLDCIYDLEVVDKRLVGTIPASVFLEQNVNEIKYLSCLYFGNIVTIGSVTIVEDVEPIVYDQTLSGGDYKIQGENLVGARWTYTVDHGDRKIHPIGGYVFGNRECGQSYTFEVTAVTRGGSDTGSVVFVEDC